jgi:hypothetical protein
VFGSIVQSVSRAWDSRDRIWCHWSFIFIAPERSNRFEASRLIAIVEISDIPRKGHPKCARVDDNQHHPEQNVNITRRTPFRDIETFVDTEVDIVRTLDLRMIRLVGNLKRVQSSNPSVLIDLFTLLVNPTGLSATHFGDSADISWKALFFDLTEMPPHICSHNAIPYTLTTQVWWMTLYWSMSALWMLSKRLFIVSNRRRRCTNDPWDYFPRLLGQRCWKINRMSTQWPLETISSTILQVRRGFERKRCKWFAIGKA